MKKILFASLIFVLFTSFSHAQTPGAQKKEAERRQMQTLDKDQMMKDMMEMTSQMSEMMKKMSGMMKDTLPDKRMKMMSKIMKDMSEQMMEMSETVEKGFIKGFIDKHKMINMKTKMRRMQRGMAAMEEKQ